MGGNVTGMAAVKVLLDEVMQSLGLLIFGLPLKAEFLLLGDETVAVSWWCGDDRDSVRSLSTLLTDALLCGHTRSHGDGLVTIGLTRKSDTVLDAVDVSELRCEMVSVVNGEDVEGWDGAMDATNAWWG